jgi:hypothetical protein
MTMSGFIIDPKAENEEQQNAAPSWMTAGTRLIWAADLTYSTSKRGEPVVEVLFCQVDDDAPGARMYERFVLNANAAWKLQRFARALGHMESFDASNETETRDIFCSRPVVCEVSTWTRNDGGERPQVDRGSFSKFTGDVTETMEDRVEKLERYAVEGKAKWDQKPSRPAATSNDLSDIPF